MKNGISRNGIVLHSAFLLVAAAVAFGQLASAPAAERFKNPDANSAVVAEAAAEVKAQAAYDRAVAAAKKKLVAELEIAKEKATKVGDLDEAVKLRDKIAALNTEISTPAPPPDKLANVRFHDTVGYTIAFMEPGVSTHNNLDFPLTEIPAPLLGKAFTQVVANHPGEVDFTLLTAGKVYICAQTGKDYPAQSATLAKMAHRESMPHLKSSQGQDWEVWSVDANAGKKYDIPFQVILVGGILEKARNVK